MKNLISKIDDITDKFNDATRPISDYLEKHASAARVLMIVCLGLVFLAYGFGWLMEKRYGIGDDENARVTSLSVCLGPDYGIVPTAEGIVEINYQQANDLYICGYLESSLSVYMTINILDENDR